MSIDWTRLTQDPNNGTVRRAVVESLLASRRVHTDTDLISYVAQRASGKRVLDIGIVSHTMEYVTRSNWRHDIIRREAAYCLGVDILAELIEELREAGYNVRAVDATSEADLGERFEVIFLGDVIEHVDNTVNLMRFARRHLSPQGVALVATPNPFSRKFIRRMRREKTIVTNLDHVTWVTPSLALEIGRRAGLALRHYHLIKPYPANIWLRIAKQWSRRFGTLEFAFPDYLYEFTDAQAH
jgi:2-polyprenyl-3-methyl-5-hydroxy-6-metoxy-1,4-benzoquinol methylase